MKLKLIVIAILVVSIQHRVVANNKKYVVCYHGSWSTYRPSLGRYHVADIDPFLCTHLVYAFVGVHDSGELNILDPYLDLAENWGRNNFKKFNALKLRNPTLKTLVAIGGWNQGSKKFSNVAADAAKRARFVDSAVQFLHLYGFDGIDLDWEFPQQRHNLSNDDQSNYVTLLSELKEGLDPFGLILSAAVAAAEPSASLSYNIPEMAKYLDFINVMSYDLHGYWDAVTGINSPLHAGPSDKGVQDKQFNIDAIIKYWLSEGAPADKLVVGVPFYGQSFTLKDSNQHEPGAPHVGRGLAGQYSREPGIIGYNELCEKFMYEPWQVDWEPDQMVPYAYNGRQWVGFESPRSVALKAQYALDNNLAGIMVWSIEFDDFRGICGNDKYPLLKEINRVLYDTATPTGLTMELTNATFAIENREELRCQTETGYIRDSNDCSKFYYCEAGVAYSFECPQSLKFDLTSYSCNYAELVKCQI